MTEVVELDSPRLIARYISDEDRVELSKRLRDHPYLRDVCLKHELGHAERGKSFWRNLWYELKETIRLEFDLRYWRELEQFKKARKK